MTLSIDHLGAFGFSERVRDAWKRRGMSRLLPLQEAAATRHGFLHGSNLLVLAPTSSGKTFIAEMAAARRLEKNRRVVYLAPTKALAEERYEQFRETFGALGFRVAVATRERPDADPRVLTGRYDLLIAVYEKMKAYLVMQPEMLRGVALVVADEIQVLGEIGRGATVDLLLTKIAHSPYGVQLLALSAVLGDDAQRLAAWLGCELMVWRERPLELREGVFDLSDRLFHFRAGNSGETGCEELAAGAMGALPSPEEAESDPRRRNAILALAAWLAGKRGEQVVVFVPTRYDSRNWAHRLAEGLPGAPAREALDALANYEASQSRMLLRRTLEAGVAFHNADLEWDLRGLIESRFNAGEIRVLVATSTLGQGVNLSGRNVLHAPAMVTTDEWTGRHAFAALSRGRFRNQGGRAGRFGREPDFGRSILIAACASERERLMRDYLHGDIEALEGRLALSDLDPFVLDLAASRTARSPEALAAFLQRTFTARTRWQAESLLARRAVEGALERLGERGFIVRGADGLLEPTGLGETAAATGLHVETVARLAEWLREGPGAFPEEPVEALLVAACTVDGRDFVLPAGPGRPSAQHWALPVRERLAGRELPETVRTLLHPVGGFSREALGDLRKTLLLEAWIGPEETCDVEERFQAFSGAAANLAAHVAWILQGAAALARALGRPGGEAEALETLAERLVLGAGPEGAALARLRVPGLSRGCLQRLVREGLAAPEAIREAGEALLERLLPSCVARALLCEAERLTSANGDEARDGRPARENRGRIERAAKVPVREPERPSPSRAGVPRERQAAASGAPLLIVDLRGPGRAAVRGREIALPPTAFRLLAALAQAPCVGLRYEEIERILWPDAQVERQQIGGHRRTLVRRLAEAIPEETAARLVRVERGRGLCLQIAEEDLRIIEKGGGE